MEHYCKQEKGYSLVTTLLIFTFIGILGFILIGMIMQSATIFSHDKNTITEKAEAEMAIEEATAQIEEEMEGLNLQVGEHPINAPIVSQKISAKLDNIAPLGSLDYTVEHEDVQLNTDEDDMFLKKVKITTPVGHSGKKLIKELALSPIAEVFQYSTFSNGDLMLNGASYMEGDVFAAGNIQNRNEGKFVRYGWSSATNYWVPTSYPAINGNLTVGGLFQHNDSGTVKTYLPEPENLHKYFSVVPKIRDRDVAVEPIPVTDIVREVKERPIVIDDTKYNFLHDFGSLVGKKTINHNPRFPRLAVLNGGKLIINGDAKVNGNLRIDAGGELIVNGNLYVGGKLKIHTAEKWWGKIRNGGKVTVNGALFVDGKAKLGTPFDLVNNAKPEDTTPYATLSLPGKDSYIYIRKEAEIKNFNFNGKMYVNRDVALRGDFNTNGTVYVRKNADIEDLSNKDGTLVLVADGEVKVANNNEYKDEPKIINAYIYSNQQLQIYGIGSHVQIRGGVYGHPVILNATKGTTKEKSFGNSFQVNKLYFQQDQQSIAPTKSRLSIIYDENIILNPPRGIPTVKKINIDHLNTYFE